MRSARAIASSTSWVTSTVIMPRLSTSFARSRCNCRASGASSETKGSSSKQQGRANGERARQRCASRQADREFAGKMRPVLGEAERGEQGGDLGFARVGRGEPHVVLDAAPRQEPRLLKNHAHSAMRRDVDRALEIAIEAGENAHQRRLAAAGRPDQRAGLAFLERERKIGDDRNALSRGGAKGLSRDARFKPRAVANGRHDVQRVAPRAFR